MLVTMSDLLKVAREHHFAVPAFNTSTNMFLGGIMDECTALNAPVIIEIHPDELAFGRPSFLKTVIEEAHNAPIPVCVHMDHGGSFEDIMHAISCGFTSVMIDASRYSLDENIAITKKVVEAAHACGISVEAELGTIGTMGLDENGNPADEIAYTDPEVARTFVDATGVDALAVAIGTRHGLYPKSIKPHLRIDLLKKIYETIDTPLVLHGGSDNPDSEIAEATKYGVAKINISSDIKAPFYLEARRVLEDKGLREPGDIYPSCIQVLRSVVAKKVRLFNCEGAAKYYPI